MQLAPTRRRRRTGVAGGRRVERRLADCPGTWISRAKIHSGDHTIIIIMIIIIIVIIIIIIIIIIIRIIRIIRIIIIIIIINNDKIVSQSKAIG